MRSLILLPWLFLACTPPIVDDDPPPDDAPPPEPCAQLPSGIQSGATGEMDPIATAATRRVVLMGGGVEVDRATQSFVEAANAGDVLVLRASGSTESYTSYFSGELVYSPAAHSVTTLLLDDPALASDPQVLCRVRAAESIWLAGGDQFDYLGRWPAALHEALAGHRFSIGGTSAGAMSLSQLAFDAALGSITSEEALADPASDVVRAVPSPFPAAELEGFLVDTHFVARDREGRLLAFLARALETTDVIRGVGLDERAALVIEGDRFSVVADGGATVSLYEVVGPATVTPGEPLTLAGVRRVVLADGADGAWPPDLSAGEQLEVVDGQIR